MPKGLVLKSTGSWYNVLSEGEIVACRIKGKFRTMEIKTSNPVTVGDKVEFTRVAEDNTGMITAIEPRKNYIIRKATRFHHEAHMIAANIDQAFLMVSLKAPATPLEFIDRFLVSAEMFFIPATILVNKTDLIEAESLEKFIALYKQAGYECLAMCLTQNRGVEEVFSRMKGKISLVSGISGVGKSSFIQALNPSLEIRIDEISESHQSGKHTTTFSEIFEVVPDCYIIDTPGIRSFGLIDLDKNEIGLYFKDVFHASAKCKYINCTHIHEPACAVRESVENGSISESRYRSYVNIFLDDSLKHR